VHDGARPSHIGEEVRVAREVIFTERELDVMGILWDRGSGTVVEVRERLEDDLAYTTVLTILRTLEEKGYVGHEEEGRAHRYHPLVERDDAQESHVRRLLRKLFAGSPGILIDRLLSHPDLTRDDVSRLRERLDRRFS
jgi:BlaI family transcriptional regulator, penicillinase repressor